MLGATKSPASLDVCVLTDLLGGCARCGRRRTRAGAAVLPARARLALRSPAVGATRRTLGTACVLLAHGTHAARTLHVRAMHTACECACTLHMHRAGVAWRPGPPRLPLPRHRHVATWTAVRRRDVIFISIIPRCIVSCSVGPHIPPDAPNLRNLCRRAGTPSIVPVYKDHGFRQRFGRRAAGRFGGPQTTANQGVRS